MPHLILWDAMSDTVWSSCLCWLQETQDTRHPVQSAQGVINQVRGRVSPRTHVGPERLWIVKPVISWPCAGGPETEPFPGILLEKQFKKCLGRVGPEQGVCVCVFPIEGLRSWS